MPVRSTWMSPRALVAHLAALLVVCGCLALGYWQYVRATGGNGLSWVYVVEWPGFAGVAVYFWWDLIHHPRREAPVDGPPDVLAPGWFRAQATAAVSSPGRAWLGRADTSNALGSGRDANARLPVDRRAVATRWAGLEVLPPGTGPQCNGEDQEDEELAAYNHYLAELHASGRRKRW